MEYAATQGVQVTDVLTHKQGLSNMLLVTAAVGGWESNACGSIGTTFSAVDVAAMGRFDGRRD